MKLFRAHTYASVTLRNVTAKANEDQGNLLSLPAYERLSMERTFVLPAKEHGQWIGMLKCCGLKGMLLGDIVSTQQYRHHTLDST